MMVHNLTLGKSKPIRVSNSYFYDKCVSIFGTSWLLNKLGKMIFSDGSIVVWPKSERQFFDWNLNCHNSFDLLQADLVSASIIIRLDFTKAFILDIDWFIWRVGAILSQKDGRNEHVIGYTSKGLSHV